MCIRARLLFPAAVFSLLATQSAIAQQSPVESVGGHIDLPSSKQIAGIVPGSPQLLTSLPVSIAVSPATPSEPAGRYIVTVNGGYGSFESGYMQSLAVLDTRSGKIEDFADPRTARRSGQVLFSGLAFSADGTQLYGTIVSSSDPTGKDAGDTGSGVQVYTFAAGRITPSRILRIPPQPLPPGRLTKLIGGTDGNVGLPYPAALAVVPRPAGTTGDTILVADQLSDRVLSINADSGAIKTSFDLSESNVVPGTYPVALAVAGDGRRAFVALSNASEVVELDLIQGTVRRKLALLKPELATASGSHPTALVLAPDGQTLYTALGNRDAVAAIDLAGGGFKLKGYFDTRLPGQSFFGAEPEALAVNADGSRVYCANMGSNAIAVLDPRKLTRSAAGAGMVEPIGFIPTEWMPMAVAFSSGRIFIAAGKGTGTGPNNMPQRPTPATANDRGFLRPFTYVATLLHGSLAALDAQLAERTLPTLTGEVLDDNRMKAAQQKIVFANGANPIRHVIYILRENRSYDQVLGDLTFNGKPVGNGDPGLTMYGREITPNLHQLALQFGVLDNFYDSGEVSGDGHVWSTSAIHSGYNERTWQINYRGAQHLYDYEGVVSDGIPLTQNIPDVAEPGTGYLWGNLARHGKTLYHFGEFIDSRFCTDKNRKVAQRDSQQGPMQEGVPCAARTEVKRGEPLPAIWGGGVSKWPWAIPLLASNTATKPELVGHFAPEAPDFNLKVPDQIRTDIFLKHLDGWIADRAAGKDTMPNFILLRLGNDHTSGTAPGGPTPKASIADNDLAVGRAVEAVSHSALWNDTAIFVVEDDAQNGADHVDAHRSIAIVASRYSPRTPDNRPFVDSAFYSTVSMVRTMESLLDLPPMNNNDAFSSLMASLFTGGDQPVFTADRSNEANGLIYTANQPRAAGAQSSARMDFRHADRADPQKLNVILWQDAMGDKPVPAMLTRKRHKTSKDADD